MALDVSAPSVPVSPQPTAGGGGRVAGNAATYLVGQTLSWAATFLSISLIPRYLGETAVGQYAIASSTVSTVSTLLAFGIGNYLVVEVGRDRANSEPLLRATIGLRLAVLPFLVLFVAGMLFISKASHMVWLLAIPIVLQTAITYFVGPLRQVVAGWEEAKRASLYDIRSAVAPLLSIPFLRYGVLALPVTSLLFSVPVQGGMWFWMRRRLCLTPSFDRKEWMQLIRGGIPFVVNDLMMQLYTFGSIFLLRHYAGEAPVGVLSQAQKLQGTSLFIPTAISAALLPLLSRLADQNREQFRTVQRRMFAVMIAFGLPVATLLFLLAEPLCRLLYGPTKFQDLPLVLQACAFNVIPLYITSVTYRFLVAERKNVIWSAFILGTAVANALFCAICIPWAQSVWSNAAIGTVVASLLAETMTVAAAFVLLKTNPLNGRTLWQIAKSVAATAGMAAVVYATRSFFIVIPAALGLLTFLILAWLFGVLEPSERNLITGAIRKRLRPRSAA